MAISYPKLSLELSKRLKRSDLNISSRVLPSFPLKIPTKTASSMHHEKSLPILASFTGGNKEHLLQ